MRPRLLAVDPGIRGSGVAFFLDGVLQKARYIKSPMIAGNRAIEAAGMAEQIFDLYRDDVDILALEWPQVYTQGKLKGDPADLLPLAAIGASLVCLYKPSTVFSYLPEQWKGQLPKGEVYEARLKAHLQISELTTIDTESCPKSLQHNVLDAIGIGLHCLGRFKPKKLIAR